MLTRYNVEKCCERLIRMIFIGLTNCPICESLLEEKHSIVMIPPFIEDTRNSLWKYTDTGMHQQCFDNWDCRAHLVALYNSFYKAHYRGYRIMNDDGSITVVE